MVSIPSPHVSVTVEDGAHQRVSFQFPGRPGPIVGVPFRPSDVQHGRTQLRAALELLVTAVQNRLIVDDGATLWSSLKRLHGLGRQLAMDYLGGTVCGELQSAFGGLCDAEAAPHLVQAPTLEINCHIDDLIPFEFLPLLNCSEPTGQASPVKLLTVLRSFLGFSFIIKRSLVATNSQPSRILENDEGLSLKLFYHAALAGAREEARFFEANRNCFRLDGKPWPETAYQEDEFDSDCCTAHFSNRFTHHLWNPHLAFDGSHRPAPDEVHHFSCHCDTTSENPDEHFLQLSHDGILEHEVPIAKIRQRIPHLARENPRPSGTTVPFIFLNACGSSVIPLSSARSFARLFLLNNGNCGILGTEASVPDAFASAFSRRLYHNLFNGEPLGQAAYATRWELWRLCTNPLGILYTLYADPAIRVRKPVQLVAPIVYRANNKSSSAVGISPVAFGIGETPES